MKEAKYYFKIPANKINLDYFTGTSLVLKHQMKLQENQVIHFFYQSILAVFPGKWND